MNYFLDSLKTPLLLFILLACNLESITSENAYGSGRNHGHVLVNQASSQRVSEPKSSQQRVKRFESQQQPYSWTAWSPTPTSWTAWAEPSGQQNDPGNPTEEPEPRNDESKRALSLLLASYSGARVVKRVGGYNYKTYLNRYRRDYWMGNENYYLDPDSTKVSRIACFFPLTPADNVYYENGEMVNNVVFQCLKYQERCCQMICCSNYPNRGADTASFSFHTLSTIVLLRRIFQ